MMSTVVEVRCEHCRRVVNPRAIVERQYDFAGLEEVMLLEVFEAEARSTSRIDFDDT